MSASPYTKEGLRAGVMHFLLGRGIAGLAGFLTIILLARHMNVQDYAGYTALSGVIALVGILAGFGLERAISRYVPEGRLERSARDLGRFIWLLSAIRVVAALILCLLIYAGWHDLPRLFPDVTFKEFPLALAGFILAETLFQHFSSVLQALVMQKTLTRVMVVQWAGRLFLVFYFVWNQPTISLQNALWVMAIPETLGVIVFTFVVLGYLQQLRKEQPKSNETDFWPDWNGVVKMSMNNYGFTLLAAPPQGYFMKMFAAILLPTQLVAAYGFFINVAERLRQYIPLHLLYNLIEPVMIANYLQDKNFKLLSDRSKLLYKSNLLLLIPVMICVVAAGPEIIGLLTAGKYQDYAWLLFLVIFQLTIGSHVVLLQLILNSVNASRVLVHAGAWALVVMAVVLSIVMQIDVRTLVIGPIVFSLTCNLYVIHVLNRMHYHYSFTWQLLSGVMAAGVSAAVLTYVSILMLKAVTDHVLLQVILSGMVLVCSYTLGLVLLRVIQQHEVHLIKSFFNKKSGQKIHAAIQ